MEILNPRETGAVARAGGRAFGKGLEIDPSRRGGRRSRDFRPGRRGSRGGDQDITGRRVEAADRGFGIDPGDLQDVQLAVGGSETVGIGGRLVPNPHVDFAVQGIAIFGGDEHRFIAVGRAEILQRKDLLLGVPTQTGDRFGGPGRIAGPPLGVAILLFGGEPDRNLGVADRINKTRRRHGSGAEPTQLVAGLGDGLGRGINRDRTDFNPITDQLGDQVAAALAAPGRIELENRDAGTTDGAGEILAEVGAGRVGQLMLHPHPVRTAAFVVAHAIRNAGHGKGLGDIRLPGGIGAGEQGHMVANGEQRNHFKATAREGKGIRGDLGLPGSVERGIRRGSRGGIVIVLVDAAGQADKQGECGNHGEQSGIEGHAGTPWKFPGLRPLEKDEMNVP